jgi:hypothetical protein
MKNLFFIVSLFFIVACRAQEKKGDNMFEKFDFESWDNNYKDYKKGNSRESYLLDDGSEFLPGVYKTDCSMSILPPKPAFYLIDKQFYRNGNIKEKGKYFGELKLDATRIKIGFWYYFDEKGNLTKEENEDKKFSKFGYNELLQFFDKEKLINLKTGENRENFKVFIDDKEIKDRKIWNVEIFTDKEQLNGFKYLLDFNTGQLLKKFKRIGWVGGEGSLYKYTLLQDNLTIYKTYKGKNYTQEEWKIFEEEEYQKHLKKKK